MAPAHPPMGLFTFDWVWTPQHRMEHHPLDFEIQSLISRGLRVAIHNSVPILHLAERFFEGGFRHVQHQRAGGPGDRCISWPEYGTLLPITEPNKNPQKEDNMEVRSYVRNTIPFPAKFKLISWLEKRWILS